MLDIRSFLISGTLIYIGDLSEKMSFAILLLLIFIILVGKLG
jgi:hypothetical protein